jgi:hypothetical protein
MAWVHLNFHLVHGGMSWRSNSSSAVKRSGDDASKRSVSGRRRSGDARHWRRRSGGEGRRRDGGGRSSRRRSGGGWRRSGGGGRLTTSMR